MQFYARLDTGAIWPKRSEPTERVNRHLACENGLVPWELLHIEDESMIAHALQGHCIFDDDLVIVLPEDDWPENVAERGTQ